MTFADTMRFLEKAGTAQNRKIYGRHGVRGALFGVSYAHLGALAKTIKTDHGLAEALWATGNHDARVLATMVADPAGATSSQLDAWARDLDNYVLADALAALVARTPLARVKGEQWAPSPNEWIGRVGWSVLARVARVDGELPEAYFDRHLATIEREIHRRKNRVRDAMNSALIAIALRGPGLRARALAAARRIGTVEVDHGATGCKTPDAAQYIARAVARGKGR